MYSYPLPIFKLSCLCICWVLRVLFIFRPLSDTWFINNFSHSPHWLLFPSQPGPWPPAFWPQIRAHLRMSGGATSCPLPATTIRGNNGTLQYVGQPRIPRQNWSQKWPPDNHAQVRSGSCASRTWPQGLGESAVFAALCKRQKRPQSWQAQQRWLLSCQWKDHH